MVSSSREKKQKGAAVLHEKLQLLGSITNSHAVKKKDSWMIVDDASKYIEELKHKVQLLNQEIATATTGQTSNSSYQNSKCPVVRVEGVEKGIEVNLYSERSCPGLLVFVLEVFEQLSLNVVDATISCTGTCFHLQALGDVVHQQNKEENGEIIDAQMVKQAILHAIQNWIE